MKKVKIIIKHGALLFERRYGMLKHLKGFGWTDQLADALDCFKGVVLLILYKVKLYHILRISIAFGSEKTKIEKFPRLKVARAVKAWVKSSVLRYVWGNLRMYLFLKFLVIGAYEV